MGFFDQASQGMKEGFTALKAIATDMTSEGKRKYKIFELKNRLQSLMAELGEAHYNSIRLNQTNADQMEKLMAEIDRMKTRISELETPPATTAQDSSQNAADTPKSDAADIK